MMGWHGNKRAWAIRKMDELDALNITIQRLLDDGMPLEKDTVPF
jgi:hypothetical protein